jgi:hypothetical protein
LSAALEGEDGGNAGSLEEQSNPSVNHLIALGWTRIAALGIERALGDLEVLVPSSRWDRCFDWCSAKNINTTRLNQLAFISEEMNGVFSALGTRINKAASAEEAAEAFVEYLTLA